MLGGKLNHLTAMNMSQRMPDKSIWSGEIVLTGLNCRRRTPADSRIAALYNYTVSPMLIISFILSLNLAYRVIHVIALGVYHFRDSYLGNLHGTC